MAPTKVPRLSIVRFLGSPVSGTILAATAESPKAIDPRRLRAPIHHEVLRGCHETQA